MANQGPATRPGRVTTVKAVPGGTAAALAAQLVDLPNDAVFIGGFGDVSIVLAFGPADGSTSDRDLLAAVVASLEPQDFTRWVAAPSETGHHA